MIHPSTFSIVGYDPQTPAWGVAVASKFPAVGAVVPWASAQAGAVATQSYANTSFGPKGLAMMAAGQSAEETLIALLAADPEKEQRQVGIVDFKGKSATFTGSGCYPWAGGVALNGIAAQGNILTGEGVVQAMVDTFLHTGGELPHRLYQALFAGDRAGGDRRGRQSAAILVVKPQGGYGGFNDVWINYRVDDHSDPVFRLGELLDMHEVYFGESPLEDKLPLSGPVLTSLQDILQRMGYYSGPHEETLSAPLSAAINQFIGNENFEERVDFTQGLIDRPVFEFLLKRFG